MAERPKPYSHLSFLHSLLSILFLRLLCVLIFFLTLFTLILLFLSVSSFTYCSHLPFPFKSFFFCVLLCSVQLPSFSFFLLSTLLLSTTSIAPFPFFKFLFLFVSVFSLRFCLCFFCSFTYLFLALLTFSCVFRASLLVCLQFLPFCVFAFQLFFFLLPSPFHFPFSSVFFLFSILSSLFTYVQLLFIFHFHFLGSK